MATQLNPKAVIFDWDDTIVSTWHATSAALNTALVAMGHAAWSEAEMRERTGPSARDLFKGLFGDDWQKADKIFYDTYQNTILDKIVMLEGAAETLRQLHEDGVYMAIVSNKRGSALRREVEHLELSKYFNKVVGAGDAPADKPDPSTIHMVLEGSGITAGADVYFIGDSATDMQCAHNAGCTPVLIETKLPPEDLLAKTPPAHRIKNHLQLMELFKR